jgi:hypothetical protein
MAAEDFFARWAKPKSVANQAAVQGAEAASPPDPLVPSAPPVPPPLPTMADVAGLTRDSDYAPFMARGVDQMVQRGAMKKLFADPHFNLMDGLDIYIGDYNSPDPLPAAMLALLDHAKGVLDPLSMFEKPVMQLVSPPKVEPESEPEPELAAEHETIAPVIPADQPLAPQTSVPADPSLDPQLSDPAAPLALDARLNARLDANMDVELDAKIDTKLDADPKKPLPDTDEHTIQSL